MEELLVYARQLYQTLKWDGPLMDGHSLRVAEYASMLAEELGLSDKKMAELEIVAIMHDVGKLYIPNWILNKPGLLTPDEKQTMEKHALYTEKYLKEIRCFNKLAYVASLHHERWDGQGYPYQLRRYEVPYEARIIAIADAFDAMTSWRPYKESVHPYQALVELEKKAGIQFWPDGVDAFISAYLRYQKKLKLPQQGGS